MLSKRQGVGGGNSRGQQWPWGRFVAFLPALLTFAPRGLPAQTTPAADSTGVQPPGPSASTASDAELVPGQQAAAEGGAAAGTAQPVGAEPEPTSTTTGATALDIEDLGKLSLEDLLDMTVTVASKTEMEISDAPSIVTVIPRSRIEAMGYRSVAEALRSVPGFFVVDDLVTQNVAVRGVHAGPASWSRIIKVMVNGHAVTYHSTGGNLLGPEFLPIEAVESIEIIRGTGSALYGANAFLGVVKVVTRRPSGVHLEAGAETAWVNQNWGGTAHAGGSVAAADDAKSFMAFAVRRERIDRSGIAIPAASPAAAGSTETVSQGDFSRPSSVFAEAGYDLGAAGSLHGQYLLQVVDAFGEFSYVGSLTHGNRFAMQNQVLGLDHDLALLGKDLQIHTYGTYTRGRDLLRERLDAGDLLFRYRPERQSTNITLGSELSYRFLRHSALVGFEYQQLRDSGDRLFQVLRRQSGTSNNGDQILSQPGESMTLRGYGAFAQLILQPWKPLSLTGGVRSDWYDVWGNTLNPRLAGVYDIRDDLSVKAVYGTSYVPPAPAQLYASPLRFDEGILGNPDLESQKASTLEVEVEHRVKDLLTTSVNGFMTLIDGRVEFVPIGNQLIARNVTSSRSLGAEASARVVLEPFFSTLSVSYQHTSVDAPDPEPSWWRLLYAEDAPGGSRPLYFPTWMAHGDVGVTYPRFHVQAAVSASYIGARKSSAANIRANGEAYLLAAYGLVDLSIRSLDLHLFGDSTTTFSLHVTNLLSQRYAEGGNLGVDIPGMPRSIFVDCTQEF